MSIKDRYRLANLLRPIVNRCRKLVEQAGYRMEQATFDLLTYCKQLKQRQVDAVNGLSDKPSNRQSEQIHISKLIDYDNIAGYESSAIKRAFHGCCSYFDKRLKYKSQHRPGGGI
jgi:hypothetical protein